MITLAGVATVTERIRLATAIVQVPQRDEVLLAKQAAVLDQLSGGRLCFGLAAGGREDDYAVFGRTIATHRMQFRHQVERIRDIWAEARKATDNYAPIGPAPFQDPGPPIWIGATAPAQIQRSVEIGDGFIFGASATPAQIKEWIPLLRAGAKESGKTGFTVQGVCHCGIGAPDQVLEEAGKHLRRYTRNPNIDVAALVLRGSTEVIAEGVRAYADAGLDLLILLPKVPRLDQVNAIAQDILPDYR